MKFGNSFKFGLDLGGKLEIFVPFVVNVMLRVFLISSVFDFERYHRSSIFQVALNLVLTVSYFELIAHFDQGDICNKYLMIKSIRSHHLGLIY
jgi:hypothetical protein